MRDSLTGDPRRPQRCGRGAARWGPVEAAALAVSTDGPGWFRLLLLERPFSGLAADVADHGALEVGDVTQPGVGADECGRLAVLLVLGHQLDRHGRDDLALLLG